MLMILLGVFLFLAWVGIPAIKAWNEWTPERSIRRVPQAPSRTNIVEDEVTVGDMVLHDMQNQNDTYDIGVIDFDE